MATLKKLEIFNRKIDEYYCLCSDIPVNYLDSMNWSFINKGLVTHPVVNFNIIKIYKRNSKNLKNLKKINLVNKLIDIKLNLSYLETTNKYFYQGPTLLVVNGNIQKLNFNTFSLLRENHYKVYLISILIEEILDLLQIIFFDELKDYKKAKWDNLVEKIDKKFAFEDKEKQFIKDFKVYRTSEMHKYSQVRGFLSREKWNHFQQEKDNINNILKRIVIKK